jgi:hypothetical protein
VAALGPEWRGRIGKVRMGESRSDEVGFVRQARRSKVMTGIHW